MLMCSHAWKGTFQKLYKTVKSFLSAAANTTAVWIDCVAVNQHSETARYGHGQRNCWKRMMNLPSTYIQPPPYGHLISCSAQNKADVASFENTLVKCSGGTIVVVDITRGARWTNETSPFSRAWCLYGVWIVRALLAKLSGSLALFIMILMLCMLNLYH